MAKSTATYKPKPGEGKARSRKKAKTQVWTADDAQKALVDGNDRTASPEIADAFTPIPPPHHPEGKVMAARPPGAASTRPLSGDLWAEAEKLAEQQRQGEQEPAPQVEEIVDMLQSSDASTSQLAPVAPEATNLAAAAMAEASKRLTEQIGIDPLVLAKMTAYMQDRCRVTLELQDGTFTMPVMSVVRSRYSVTLLIPLDPKSTTFVPKPGTQVTMTCGEFCEEVYFPGAYVEVEPLTIAIMTFVRTADSTE
jgi:hypothetical protein